MDLKRNTVETSEVEERGEGRGARFAIFQNVTKPMLDEQKNSNYI